jgi:hypothetical protein
MMRTSIRIAAGLSVVAAAAGLWSDAGSPGPSRPTPRREAPADTAATWSRRPEWARSGTSCVLYLPQEIAAARSRLRGLKAGETEDLLRLRSLWAAETEYSSGDYLGAWTALAQANTLESSYSLHRLLFIARIRPFVSEDEGWNLDAEWTDRLRRVRDRVHEQADEKARDRAAER